MLMVVMTPREKWTDERLDGLEKKVDDGFERVDGDIKDLRQEMNARFDKLEDRLWKVAIAFVGGASAVIAAFIAT